MNTHGTRKAARARQVRKARRTPLASELRGRLEVLESRRLLAATPELVRDINPNFNPFGEYSDPRNLTAVGNTLYFSADDGTSYHELWKSDGTESGTVLVKDIWPGVYGFTPSYPTQLTNVGGTLYFLADDGTSGIELWKSNGTEAGTVRVKDIRAGANSSSPGNSYLTNVNGTLFFAADNGVDGVELWKSDGSEAGTVQVKNIHTNFGTSSYPAQLTNVGGTLFFIAADSTNGRELWKSDGTEAGTVRVKDIRAGGSGSYPNQLTNVGGVLYFSADEGTNGVELWKSDGSAAGTVRVKDIRAGAIGSEPNQLTNVGGTLFFRANEGTNGVELWKSNGTEAGTIRVKDIVGGAGGSFPQYLTDVGGMLFFRANEGTNGLELWKSDGTEAGTVRVKDIHPGGSGSEPAHLTNVGGKLFFSASDGTNGRELWTSDGTEAGTVQVGEIADGVSDANPAFLSNVGGTLYFSADDGVHGNELWKLVPDAVSGSLPFSDNFNRADGTSLGSDWSETLGNVGITNQQVVLYQNTESTAVLTDIEVADVNISASVDLSTAPVGRSIALMARAQGPGDENAYWGVYYRSDSGFAAQIYKHTGGVPTALRSVNVPGPTGSLRFEIFGTTLNLYFNETLVTSVIDDAISDAGAVGVRQTGGAIDNFAASVAVPPLSENAVLPFSDNFDRVNNSLLGSFWTERSGDAGVKNNAAGLYANDTSVVTVNGISEADVSVSADFDITGVPAQFSSGLLARYSGPGDTNTYMARLYRSDSGLYFAQIWKNVGGAYTPLRSVGVPSGAGNLRFDVAGDQLQLFFNESLVASTIDTSIAGPGLVGMRLLGGTADNFFVQEPEFEPVTDAELPFVDDFNREDDSWLGEFWTERAGDQGVSNQQMALFAGEQSIATLNGVSETDIEVAADIDISAGGNAGLLARYTGPGDTNAYLGLLQPASGGTFAAQIWKNTGAGWQNLTHSIVGSGAGELAFLLEGNHLQLYFDETLVGDVIDNSITGPGTVGVRQGGGTVDNFEAEVPIDLLFALGQEDGPFEQEENGTFETLLDDLLLPVK